jgi:hypothetical protein
VLVPPGKWRCPIIVCTEIRKGVGIRAVTAIHVLEDFRKLLAHHFLAPLGIKDNGARIWRARIFGGSNSSLVFCLVTPCDYSG